MANIFLTYLGISATVGIVVLIILLASPLINRRYAAKWKYYIWIFLAIRLLIPISGMYHKEPKIQPSAVSSNTVCSSGTVVYEPVGIPDVQPRRFVVEIPVGTAGQVTRTPDTNSVRPKLSLFDIVFSAWIAGMIIFTAVPLIICLHCKYRITHGGERLEAGEAYEIFLRMKSRLKIKRNVWLIRYPKAASPMIIGFIKPALVLPCDDLSTEELQFIIRHELIHLKRGDVYIKLLCVLANAVHWFNPLIWIMRREAAIDMELSCDDGVIKGKSFDVRRAYTETLLSSLSRQSSKASSLTTQFYGGKKTMKKRFTNILGHTAKKNGAALLVWAIALAIISGSMVGCSQEAPKASPTAEHSTADDSVRLLSAYRNLNMNGELYRDSISGPMRLTYTDFDTLVAKPVCPDPECKHINPEDCPALGFTVHPCVIDSMLYGFEHDYQPGDSGYYEDSGVTVWMADTDGSNKTQIDALDVSIDEYSSAALIGSTLYFIGMDKDDIYTDAESADGMPMVNVSTFEKYYLCSYDFIKKEFVNYGYLCEGYQGSAYICGRYKGGLYISATYKIKNAELEDIPILTGNMSDPEAQKAYEEWSKERVELAENYEVGQYFRFDLETGEITNSDLPLSNVTFLTDDIYGYVTDDPQREYCSLLNIVYGEDDVKTYWNFIYVGDPVNGYLFINDNTAINIATGEVRALKKGVIPQYFTVQAYHNGRYILMKDWSHREYKSIPEEDMFED